MHFAIEILGLCNESSFEVCEQLFRSGRKWSFLVLFDLQSHSSVKRKKIGKKSKLLTKLGSYKSDFEKIRRRKQIHNNVIFKNEIENSIWVYHDLTYFLRKNWISSNSFEVFHMVGGCTGGAKSTKNES